MIRIGIIGTGLIAQEHARAISMLSGCARLVAASDVLPERLQVFCDSFEVPRAHHDAAELIADREVDLVTISTPPSAHEALAVAALDCGKYVFCEKPLAHSLASALRIAGAEARHPGKMAVGHQYRYDTLCQRLVWLCRNNSIGEIRSALIERHGYAAQAGHAKSGWWGAWAIAGGGVLITQLIHELDLLVLLMGCPISVRATMDTRYTRIESEDYVEATFRFAKGGTAHCIASVNSGCIDGRFTIEGSAGTAGLPWNFTTKDPSRTRRVLKELDRALPDTRPPSPSLLSWSSRFVATRSDIKAKPSLTPHARLYQEIARNIENKKPLPVPPSEALASLELCLAAYESALTLREVVLPLGPSYSAYHGVSKQDYEQRKGFRTRSVHAMGRTSTYYRNTGIRIGLIGLDTSHALTFTGILHDPYDPFHIPGARVVVAYPGGSPDLPISITRVGGFTSELRDKYGVRIVDAPEDVAEACDLVFILSSDGRLHPALFRAVAGRGKPVFIDKPFAVSASDAQDIFTVASQTGTRVFASSAFRYADGLVSALKSIRVAGERVKGCCICYWLQIQETQGRYFWYGIHATEMLLAIMGTGVRKVEASGGSDGDSITAWHDEGRPSHLLGSISDGRFHVSIETDRRELKIDLTASMPSISARVLWAALDVLTEGWFPRLWGATAEGSVSGPRPGRALDPSPEETLEVVRLLDAAQRSYLQQRVVSLDDCTSGVTAR